LEIKQIGSRETENTQTRSESLCVVPLNIIEDNPITLVKTEPEQGLKEKAYVTRTAKYPRQEKAL
jgi:hypothetical protein